MSAGTNLMSPKAHWNIPTGGYYPAIMPSEAMHYVDCVFSTRYDCMPVLWYDTVGVIQLCFIVSSSEL